MGEFARLIKEARIDKGITLREFCLKNGFQPSNMSKYERGHLAPPCPEKIANWLRKLGYRQDKDTRWQQIMWAARDEMCKRAWDKFDSWC